MFRKLFLLLTLMLFVICSFSQTVPLGILDNIDDLYKRKQLDGTDKSGVSFLIRPLQLYGKVLEDGDSSYFSYAKYLKVLHEKGKVGLYAMPIILQQQYNTFAPYGMNDNSMVQAKGYQSLLSAGVLFKAGPLRIQLYPEYVFAENKKYLGVESVEDAALQKAYANNSYGAIDNPSSFGSKPRHKLGWGQSSIRLTFDPVSIGLSNENLWWGPGQRNSLLMSNNASGFRHVTINTTRPVKTIVGDFEAQIVGGRLEQSGVDLIDNVPTAYKSLYKTRVPGWRYFNGMAFTYRPKWVPNLYLGFDRAFIVNRSDMGNSIGDYLPIFTGVTKANFVDPDKKLYTEDSKKRDQYISLFAKWVMVESRSEIYFQFGRNDHSHNLRDFFQEPEHSRGYIAGFRKLLPLSKPDEYVQVGIEFTQLQETKTVDIREGNSWYSHFQVKDGYTHKGQVIGAAIGPGSNMQSLDVSWVKGLKRIGLTVDRVLNNNDLIYRSKELSSDIRKHWVDLAFTGRFAWDFDHIVLNSALTYNRSLNYQWQVTDPNGAGWDWPKQNDMGNLQFKVGLLYNFN